MKPLCLGLHKRALHFGRSNNNNININTSNNNDNNTTKTTDVALAAAPSPCLVVFHKPYHVLSQFSSQEGKRTLSDFPVLAAPPGLYPAGRLDYDSEGLLLLTNHGPWQARVAHPRHKLRKTYWAQVEGQVADEALWCLCGPGVDLRDGRARAIAARRLLPPPEVNLRDPPVRYRAHIPTDWLELVLDEGRNRQVRRMTAAVGIPTLRLIRVAVGPWRLNALLPPGTAQTVDPKEAALTLGHPRKSATRPYVRPNNPRGSAHICKASMSHSVALRIA